MNKDESSENSDWKFYDWTCWIWLVMINGGHILFLVNSWVIAVNPWKYSQKVKGFNTNINPHRKCVMRYYRAVRNLNSLQLVILQSVFPSVSGIIVRFFTQTITKHPCGKCNSSYMKIIIKKTCTHCWLVWIFTLKKKSDHCVHGSSNITNVSAKNSWHQNEDMSRGRSWKWPSVLEQRCKCLHWVLFG